MKARMTKAGFTLIELLIALVVGGLLMAALVALSGSVQRSFGRSKEINDLQTNLRFALKTLVEDLARISFMQSPKPAPDALDPLGDYCHRVPGGLDNADLHPAIDWNPPRLDLWGNYASARDYLWDRFNSVIVCRNQIGPGETDFATCGPDGGYETYLLPFADGPSVLGDLFCPDMTVRIDAGDRRYLYEEVAGIAPPWGLMINNVDPNLVSGRYLWINPINNVEYEVAQDPGYTPLYSPAANAASNFQLVRRLTTCRDGLMTVGLNVFLADFLLPPDDPVPGLQIDFIADQNAQLCSRPAQPALTPPVQFLPATGAVPDSVRTRAMIVTLRGRTETEDPAFTIQDYAGRGDRPQRYGINLDADPKNGLAYVREVRTVIQLRNLGLNLNL